MSCARALFRLDTAGSIPSEIVYSSDGLILVGSHTLVAEPKRSHHSHYTGNESAMLDKLRATGLSLIATAGQATLSTAGPAGVQASVVSCHVYDGCIYLLIPSTSDHLFNLEQVTEVVLTTAEWVLRGAVLGLTNGNGGPRTPPPGLGRRACELSQVVVEVFPLRMHLLAGVQRPYPETIDFAIPTMCHGA
jgi:hypothetical protein